MDKSYRNNFTDPKVIEKIKNIESSKQYQIKLDEIKKSMMAKVHNPFKMGCFTFIAFIFIGPLFGRMGIIIFILIAIFLIKKYIEDKHSLGFDYANSFLLPVLKEILPNTYINYYGGMDEKVYKRLIPKSTKFYSNCHIVFGDEYKSEFSNLTTSHIEKDKDDREYRVIDFMGQVLKADISTNVNGHIRIVPTVNKPIFGKKRHYQYGDKEKCEKDIEVESISFNEDYSIFSTDDFYTRLLLRPDIIEILYRWSKDMMISLYMNNESIALSFSTDCHLFPQPRTKEEVSDLSLSGEYEKIRIKLKDFYSLLDMVCEDL